MLSILIPTYNYNVTELVIELEKQATNAGIIFEVLVLDDGSNERQFIEENEKINSFDNCSYTVQTENLGRTQTRQNLALNAAHELLVFLDADVLPKYGNFIENFELIDTTWDIQFGGITYRDEKPETNEILRWKYGKERESLSLGERNKQPYLSINSGAFMIKKDLFLRVNSQLNFKKYGLDNLFKQLLKKEGVSILHIDNPVYHLGLESTSVFIQKSKESVKTTFDLELEGLIDNDLRPLQKSYLKFKKFGLIGVFLTIMKKFEGRILKNLNSKNPSLFYFDLYRLQYYCELKSAKNA